MEFCLLTFSVSDMKELDLSIHDIPEGMLEIFFLQVRIWLDLKTRNSWQEIY